MFLFPRFCEADLSHEREVAVRVKTRQDPSKKTIVVQKFPAFIDARNTQKQIIIIQNPPPTSVGFYSSIYPIGGGMLGCAKHFDVSPARRYDFCDVDALVDLRWQRGLLC